MIITIVNIEGPTTVKKYQVLEVAFKDESGSVKGKKLMSFTYPEVFNTIKGLSSGDKVEITNVKEGDYWQWTEAKKVEGNVATSNTNAATSATQAFAASANDRYETKEERQARQVMIVRQSSLSNAVSTLSVGGKVALDPNKVIEVAREYEDYVLGKGVQGLIDMDSDLPE